MSVRILFVCTGNICRSPMAELLFQARTDPGLPVLSASAGTSGLTGWGMDPPSAVVLRELGSSGDGHLAQRLSPELVAQSELILTAEAWHRDAIVEVDPRATERIFTLREFGRLGAGLGGRASVTADDLRGRIARIGELRAHAAPVERGVDDIGDPYGASLREVRACGAQIAAAVDALIDGLGLPRAGAPGSGVTT